MIATRAARSSQSDASAAILREDRGPVTWLRLNRPAQRNALSLAAMTELQSELDRARKEASVRVIVLAGAGPAFCAGHDLRELRANPSRPFYEQTFALCSRLMLGLTRLPKPVIACVHGVASAAGCQLVASCDLAVAARSARFATPGVDIGLFCSTPMVALSRAIGRKPALEMLLTGDMMDAETALARGLVNRVVDDAGLAEATQSLASQIAAKSPLTLAVGKEAFYRQAELDLDAAYAYASEVMTRNMMARDAEEGIDAFLAKREPTWRGE